MMVVAVLAIILTLLLVIGLHEAGHAALARLFSIKIQRVSIGFGKPLLQWNSASGCEWVFAMWPLGGYVHLLNSRIHPVTPEQWPQCFDKRPIWQRFLVYCAGPGVNLLVAWLAFFMVFAIGIDYQPPQIHSVVANSVATQSGFLAGDRILEINHDLTPTWRDVGMQWLELWGQKGIEVRVLRGAKEEHLTLDLSQIALKTQEKSLFTRLGIVPDLKIPQQTLRSASIGAAFFDASEAIGQWVYFLLVLLKQLIMGVIPFNFLLGPIGLFATSINSITQGIMVFAYFIASFSVAVAVVNLFPLPGLDGGSILYLMIEKIRGKPLSVAMEILLYRLVLIAFSVLLVQLLLNDVQHFLT